MLRRYLLSGLTLSVILLLLSLLCSLFCGQHFTLLLDEGNTGGMLGEPWDELPRQAPVLLLAVDGLDLSTLQTQISKGNLPTLARIWQQGSHSLLTSLQSSPTTKMRWQGVARGLPASTFMSQRLPAAIPNQAEVRDNKVILKESAPLWDILSKSKRRVAVIGWPGTWPVQSISGWMVSDKLINKGSQQKKFSHLLGYLFPDYLRNLWQQISHSENSASPQPTPAQNIFKQALYRKKGSAQLPHAVGIEPIQVLRNTLSEINRTKKFVDAAVEQLHPQLLMVALPQFDTLLHSFMPFAPPRMEDIHDTEYLRFSNVLNSTYQWLDQFVDQQLSHLPAATTLVLVSTHGFYSGDQRPVPVTRHAPAPKASAWHRQQGFVWVFTQTNGVNKGAKSEHKVLKDISIENIAPILLCLLKAEPIVGDSPNNEGPCL